MSSKTLFQKGFTLVEMTVVIVVLGLLIGFFFAGADTALRFEDYTKTNTDMDIVTESLHEFARVNGRYPCPADRTALRDSEGYGVELADCQDATDSAAVGVSANDLGAEVLTGALPVRSLNLPDSAMFDEFDSQLLYAVSASHVVPVNDGSGGQCALSTEPQEVSETCGFHATGCYMQNGNYNNNGPSITTPFKADDCSDFVSAGEYGDASSEFPTADRLTFDGLAILKGTRVTFYSERDFKGDILAQISGPAIAQSTDHGDISNPTVGQWDTDPNYWSSVKGLEQFQDGHKLKFSGMWNWGNGSVKVECLPEGQSFETADGDGEGTCPAPLQGGLNNPTEGCFFWVSGGWVYAPGVSVSGQNIGKESVASNLVGAGEYNDAMSVFAKAHAYTFDGIAVGKGTRVIMYSGKDFTGNVEFDGTGPFVLQNGAGSSTHPALAISHNAHESWGKDSLTEQFSDPDTRLSTHIANNIYTNNMHNLGRGSVKVLCGNDRLTGNFTGDTGADSDGTLAGLASAQETAFTALINTPGAITMLAEEGLQPITETMQFTVMSLGDDRRGAFSRDGASLVEDCPANTQDAENCDGDATFRNLPNTQMVETDARFDDIVKFGHARPWRPCSFGGETVEHAGTIKRFQSAQSNNCTSQTYECNDGKLFWPADPERDTSTFFQHKTCEKPPPPPPPPATVQPGQCLNSPYGPIEAGRCKGRMRYHCCCQRTGNPQKPLQLSCDHDVN